MREQLVKTALQYLDSLAPDARGDAALQLELATAYSRVGDIQNSSSSGNLGQVREAIASWEKAVVLLRELGGRANGNDESRRLSSTLLHLGMGRYQLGDFAGAEREFTRALEIAERLVAARPDGYALLRVTSARNRLGDLKVRMGQGEAALAHYRPVLRMLEDLARREPDVDLAIPLPTQHLRIGDALHATGDPAQRAARGCGVWP